MLVSIVMSSFNRSVLLNQGLKSIKDNLPKYPLEIVVVNDGLEDETKSVCESYKDILNIRYVFTGQRNKDGIISRNPSIPMNIGIKQSFGDIIILSCPEIQHLNNGLDSIIDPLLKNSKFLTIPNNMYFDDSGLYTKNLINNEETNLDICNQRTDTVKMPFLIGMWRDELFNIGGYDEDFTGYAAEDNDLVDRLIRNGNSYHRVDSKIVHLYHGKRCTGKVMWDNPDWVHNYTLFKDKKGIIVRNEGRDWGKN